MGIILLCAASGTGKTTFLCNQLDRLAAHGKSVGGAASPCVFEHDRRIGYDLLDLRSKARRPLARTGLAGDAGQAFAHATGGTAGVALIVGVYRFDADALAAGNAAIIRAVRDGLDIIAMDEVGPLEMRGGGWSPAIEFALRTFDSAQRLILTVRPSLADKLPARFPSTAWAAAMRLIPPWPASLEV